MKHIITAIFLMGMLFAQADIVSPSDGIGYTIKEMARGIHVFITDISGDEVEQVRVRMEIQRELYQEMNKEYAKGNQVSDIELKELSIRNEVQQRVIAINAGTTSASKEALILQKQRERLQLELNAHEQIMEQQQLQFQPQIKEKVQASVQSLVGTATQAGENKQTGGVQ